MGWREDHEALEAELAAAEAAFAEALRAPGAPTGPGPASKPEAELFRLLAVVRGLGERGRAIMGGGAGVRRGGGLTGVDLDRVIAGASSMSRALELGKAVYRTGRAHRGVVATPGSDEPIGTGWPGPA